MQDCQQELCQDWITQPIKINLSVRLSNSLDHTDPRSLMETEGLHLALSLSSRDPEHHQGLYTRACSCINKQFTTSLSHARDQSKNEFMQRPCPRLFVGKSKRKQKRVSPSTHQPSPVWVPCPHPYSKLMKVLLA